MSNAILKSPPMTVRDYLERERKSETKHEFVDGELIAMAGNAKRTD